MRIVSELAQNSKEWKSWRGKGIGASDAPVIMGGSPWQSALELWLDKTGLKPRSEPNVFSLKAMERGTALEPKARELFEQEKGKPFPALSAEHDNYPFIRASFDGYNAEENAVLEIKCPGKADHAKALKGQVPEKYYPQLQQQMLVSGATKAYYYSWDGVSPGGVCVEVPADHAYQAELLSKLVIFWSAVSNRTLPAYSYSDLLALTSEVDKKAKELVQLTQVVQLMMADRISTNIFGEGN